MEFAYFTSSDKQLYVNLDRLLGGGGGGKGYSAPTKLLGGGGRANSYAYVVVSTCTLHTLFVDFTI